MSDFLHDSRLQIRVPLPCRHSRMLLRSSYHSRLHLHVTPPCLVSPKPIENLICRRISRQSGRKRELSLRLQVVQSWRAVTVATLSGTLFATRWPVSRRRHKSQSIALSRVKDHSSNRLEISATSWSSRRYRLLFARMPSWHRQLQRTRFAYSTHCCRFPSFERCAVKQFGIRHTVARALDVLAAKPLPCNITAPVH